MAQTERVRSWIPIIIRDEQGGHQHGLLFWDWSQPWRADRLAKGVDICGFGPMDKKCKLCQTWGAMPEFAPVPRPLDVTPEAVGDHRKELLESAETPRNERMEPKTEQNPVQEAEKPASGALFDDF